jgi:hypothetical protein
MAFDETTLLMSIMAMAQVMVVKFFTSVLFAWGRDLKKEE